MAKVRENLHAPVHIDDDLAHLDAAWLEVLSRHHPWLDVASAVLRLTEAGNQPVDLDQIAAAVGRPISDTALLVDRAGTGSPWHRIERDGDRVRLELVGSETPRFFYRIGDRRIGVDGCAPDAFFAAHALDQPMRVESTCPVSGTAITVDLAPDGPPTARPDDTVVALIDPTTTPDAAAVADANTVDADICLQQPFFANASSAEPWLGRNPTGRVVPIADFDAWFRDLRRRAAERSSGEVGT